MQGLISFMTVVICSGFLWHQIEKEWAKNILVMIVSVWFPTPSISGRGTIFQNEEYQQAISPTSPVGRRWGFAPNVQRATQGSLESGKRNGEKFEGQKKP